MGTYRVFTTAYRLSVGVHYSEAIAALSSVVHAGQADAAWMRELISEVTLAGWTLTRSLAHFVHTPEAIKRFIPVLKASSSDSTTATVHEDSKTAAISRRASTGESW